MATTTIPAQMENPFVDTQGDVDSVLEPAKVGFKRYSLYYTTSRLDARLHLGSSTSPASYYFESKMALSSPQLFLRRGADATAPVVNFARLQSTSRHILLGAGSYTKQAAEVGRVAWEELRREKNLMHRSDYHFSTGVADDDNNNNNSNNTTGRRRRSAGVRTRIGYSGLSTSASTRTEIQSRGCSVAAPSTGGRAARSTPPKD